MRNLVCFHCGLPVEGKRYFMQALDKPYVNLFFHTGCVEKIGNFPAYLTENAGKVYNYVEKYPILEKNVKKAK